MLALQRSVSYVTQGWVDRSMTLLAEIPYRNPLYCSDIVLCIALGMTVLSDLSTHLTGCLIINSTEEIGTLVMVTNKRGQVSPVDSLYQARGADIYRVATFSLASILLKSHKVLGFNSVVALFGLSGIETITLRSPCFPQDFRTFPYGLVHVPLDK